MVCIPSGWNLGDLLYAPIACLVYGIGSIFCWAKYGGWFFLGLISLGGIPTFILAFTLEHRAKFSLFATFTTATLYYSTLTFENKHWLMTLGIYAAIAFCYWISPRLMARYTEPS